MTNGKEFDGLTALVTGASRGIGAETAFALASRGAFTLIHYNSSDRQAAGVLERIRQTGGDGSLIQADLSRSEGIQCFVDLLRQSGSTVDILVNNAGSLIERTPFLNFTEELWNRVFTLNLTGATFAFAPALTPPPIAVTSATIDSTGTSATLGLTIAANAVGSFTLAATNTAGSSSLLSTANNTLSILDPNGDADGDGLTNAVEIAIGTNPLSADSDNDGMPDGWEVFYGLNPLNPADASAIAADGLTNLQNFKIGHDPRSPNLTPPAVSQIFPANGATNVFINDVIVARFAEPLQIGASLFAAQTTIAAALGSTSNLTPAQQQTAALTLQLYMNRTCCGNSVVAGSVTVTGPHGGVGGTVAPSSDGLSLTFAPSQPLAANTTYTVTIQGLRDSAGNLMTKVFQSSFTTGSSLDNTPPKIVRVDPANNATNVPTNVHYTVQFSKAVDPSTLTPSNFTIVDNTSNTPVAGVISTDSDNMTAYFVPNQLLAPDRSFTVTLTTGVKDFAGNGLASNSTYTFTTGSSPDTDKPHLVSTSPPNGATGIPANSLIDLLFNEPLDVATVAPNIQVLANGQPIPISIATSYADERVTITPVQGLQASTLYTVTVGSGIADLGGNLIDNPGSFTFTTGALVVTTPPSVSTVDPNGQSNVPLNAVISIRFNQVMDAVTLNTSSIEVYPYSAGLSVIVPGTVAVSADGESATFTPSSPLEAETVYEVYVQGITDLEGQGLQQNGNNIASFTTGTATQTTAPTVVAVSPPNGATNVPVNAAVTIELSGPVSAVSVETANGLVLSAGGVPVAGMMTPSAANTILTFRPANPLVVNTVYMVSLSGVTDLAGNAVAPFTSAFTTGASGVPDTGPLNVTAVSPANGATNVPVNSSVTVTFNEAVDPATVSEPTLNLSTSAGNLATSDTVNGSMVTLTPATPLPGNSVVSVNVGSVTDLAGNGVSGYSGSSFTTASTQDTTPPTVISITPNNGATGIGSNGQVVITFSKSMNPATLTSYSNAIGRYNNIALLTSGTRLYFQLSVSPDNRTVTLSSLSLPVSTVVTVVVTHTVTDLSNNPLADFQSQFTTAARFDTSHASVVNQRPGNGATGVPLTDSIVLFVNEALDASTVPGALHVSQNGQLVNGTVNVTDNGQVIEFTPSAPFSNGALVQVFLDSTALDTDGATVSVYQGSFTTVPNTANTPPVVVATSLPNGAGNVPLNAVIEVGYNQALDASTVTTSDVILNGPGGQEAVTVGLDSTGTVIRIVPNSPLAASSEYCYYVQSGVEGTNGQAAQTYGTCFTTGAAAATAPPQIVAVSPPDGAVNAPVNANLRVLFNEPIDPLTVSGTTIQLSGGGQTLVPAAISFSNQNVAVLVTPQAPLPASTQMTLTINGVTDVAGNAVTAKTTHFTTGTGPDTVTPLVVSANPPPGTTGVPVNVALSLQANAAIDPTTVNSSTFLVQDNTTNQSVAGTYSQSADGMTVYFAPSAPLAAGRQYNVYFGQRGMTDLAGNLLTCCAPNFQYNNFSFTTGFAASTTAPQVGGA